MPLSRRRYARKYPPPAPTPKDKVWASSPGKGTQLVPMEFVSNSAMRKMGNYDLYPREYRDAIKETNKRPQ